MPRKKLQIAKLLKTPQAVIIGMISGILLGLYFKQVAVALRPIANAYVSLLMFSILPLVFASIIFSLAKVLEKPTLRARLKIVVLIVALGIFIPSMVGLAIGSMNHSENGLSPQTQAKLGRLVKSVEYYPAKTTTQAALTTESLTILSKFLKFVTPDNVLSAFNEGLSIKTIIIALLIGLSLGKFQESPGAKNILSFVETTRNLFQAIFSWILVFLPFGLLAVFAATIGKIDFSLLSSLATLLFYMIIASVLLSALYLIIIKWAVKQSFKEVLLRLKKPLSMAFVFNSVLIPLPASLETCEQFQADKDLAETVLPIVLLLNRHGSILLFSMISLFVAHFYYPHVSLEMVLLIWLLSSVIGMFSLGRNVSLIGTLGIILHVIGTPLDLALLILAIVEPLVARFNTMLTVIANIALIALTSGPRALFAGEQSRL